MAEVRVRKPLYEDSPNNAPRPAGNKGDTRPNLAAARPARAPKLARVAALGLDFVAIQGLLHLIVLYGFDAVIGLGVAGPFVGWAFAMLYFTVCYSSVTGGRTLGKAVLRLRVASLDGMSLGLGRAMFRAALLVWPILVFTSVDVYAKLHEAGSEYSFERAATYVAMALVLSWLLGSFAHSVVDPHGRSFADRTTGSVVVATDATPDDYAAYMTEVRDGQPDGRLLLRARMWLVIVAAAMPAFASYQVYNQHKSVVSRPNAEREKSRQVAADLAMPGFFLLNGIAEMVPPGTPNNLAADKDTTTVVYQYRRFGRVDADTVKNDLAAQQKPAAFVALMKENVREAQRETTAPLQGPLSKMRVYVSFCEFADLTFAFRARGVMGFAVTEDFTELARPQDLVLRNGAISEAGTSATVAADAFQTTPTLSRETGTTTTP